MEISSLEVAKAEILQRLYEYSWGYDTNNMKLMGGVFSDYAKTGGVVSNSDISWGPWTGRENIVKELSSIRNSQNDKRRHVITSHYFDDITETKATVKVYLSLFSHDKNHPPSLVTTGSYLMQCQKYEHKWLIDLLEEVLESPF